MTTSPELLTRLKRAGAATVFGLAVVAISVQITHPLSFMSFAVFGVGGVAVGVALFLHAIATRPG